MKPQVEPDRFQEATMPIRARIIYGFGLADLDRISYFRFRSQSEQEEIKEESWE